MDKIKKQLPRHQNKYYIGIRSTDRMYTGYFQSDISIFSESAGPDIFPVRPNQNKSSKYMMPYLMDRVNAVLAEKPDSCFVFYNGMMAYRFPPDLHKHFICLNSRELLQSLNNKAEMKLWLADCNIPILPYETFLGQKITLSVLAQHFPKADAWVIQSGHGGGGMGTFLVSDASFETVQPFLQPLRRYLVSAYIRQGISVNTHIFISDKQTVLSPGSVQIVGLDQEQLCYHGADFIAFRKLPEPCREQVRELSLKIANRLRQRGYRGVAGLDFLVTKEQKVYCMEVNPRFQASSFLLDIYLQGCKAAGEHGAGSIFDLNEQAFQNQMITTLCFDDVIDYSCYYYYKQELPLHYFAVKRAQLLEAGAFVHDDGFLLFDDEVLTDKDSYLFRAVFPHAICAISPDMTLWLNDNIPVIRAPDHLMDLKIALLNQGVQIPTPPVHMKKGVYESVDITYQGALSKSKPVIMNCAYQVNLSQYSPWKIVKGTNGDELTYYGESFGHIEIEIDRLADLPHTDQRILYLSADRLRIKLIAGCEYKNVGLGCRFCNLPLSDKRFSHQEIEEALLHLKQKRLSFRHILIGGGSCLSPDIWGDVAWLCHYLKSDTYYQDKPISLMSVLPPKEMLPTLYEAGLEEVAFNIEVSDEATAQKLMPGKRRQTKAAYYRIFEDAVKIFGIGSVRCALLVGFDQEKPLLDEVRRLAQMNVLPCLSAFRALPNSEFSSAIHPDNASLRRVYDACSNCLAALGTPIDELGPKCHACRNNMLAI